MAEAKTQPTTQTLENWLSLVPDPERRKDCAAVAALMEEVVGEPAVIWGTGIVGFGRYSYQYASGKVGIWPLAGFASRKTDLTLYIGPTVDSHAELLPKLGKFKHGKVCVYVKRLSDIDLPTLKKMIQRGLGQMKSVRV